MNPSDAFELDAFLTKSRENCKKIWKKTTKRIKTFRLELMRWNDDYLIRSLSSNLHGYHLNAYMESVWNLNYSRFQARHVTYQTSKLVLVGMRF